MKNGKRVKIICVVTASVLILAAIVVSLIVVNVIQNSSNERQYPEYNHITDGVEERVYYYEVAGGRGILKLNSNWRFTLDGPELSKSGDYFPEGGGITLDFVRDDDGTASATPGKNKIVLVMGDATMTFREQVDFTVSFYTSDTANPDEYSVLNGKTAKKPQDPVKDGFTFDGWYSDKELTKPFNFSTIITENTSLYAKWTENK